MRKLFSVLSILATVWVHAQKTPDPRPFAATITAADLATHLYIFAGKEFEGRETTTWGQRKAASYIENYFRSIGLQPGNKDSFQMVYPVFQDSLTSCSIRVNGHSFDLNKDFAVNASSNNTATLIGSEIIFAGYGISDSIQNDYKGLDVKGKIVMILNGLPGSRRSTGSGTSAPPFHRGNLSSNFKVEAARRNGASALLIIQGGFPRNSFGDKGPLYREGNTDVSSPNLFYVSDKIAGLVMGDDFAIARSGSPQPKSYPADILLQFSKQIECLQGSDVLGFLEGTDLKDQLVVLSAHYDHLGKMDTVIYYGADDDGSGTVGLLELAQAFAEAKTAGKGPRRSVLFLANSGEENGLWGSAYYTDHPSYPLENTTVNLNIDMIGRIDPNRKKGDSTNYVYVIGDDKLSSDLHPINVAQNKKYTKLELDYKYNDPKDPQRIYYRSDHYNFARNGVPIIFYFDGIHSDYHRPSDTPDKINYNLLEKRTRLVFYTAWEMANRDDMLKRDIPLK
ncbi:M28 family peptidase [Flavitalea flava]